MREIKFKAWVKELNEIREVEYINFLKKMISYPNKFCKEYYLNADFDEIELMQYTGLKDEYGDEIYEGDIVKLRANHGIGVVKYYDEWGAFVVEYIKPKKLAVLGMNYYEEDIEVIGNIYENPELLGDKNDF